MADAVKGYMDAQGGPLYYETAGAGHALALIHAGVADHTMWDDQFSTFAQHYRVIRYDTRGFGKTPVIDVNYSNRQDLYDLLTHLGVEKAYVLGVSRGGQIATDFTLEHPEMVAAHIPVAAGLSGFEGSLTDDELEIINQMEAAWENKDFTRLADLDVLLWADGPGQPEGRAPESVRERVRAMCQSNYALTEGTGQPIVLDPPAIDRLGEIHAPTLIIVGDLDTSSVLESCNLLEKGIANAKKVVIPDTAHMLSMEEPEEFSGVVLGFLGSL